MLRKFEWACALALCGAVLVGAYQTYPEFFGWVGFIAAGIAVYALLERS